MRKVVMTFSTMLLSITFVGCGDVTVNPPARSTIIVEEKRERPVIIEKTVVEKPVIIEKKTIEKPVIIIEKH